MSYIIPNILVVGDLIIDNYLWGSCERISPEAPVQIIDVSKEVTVLGGAGNVAHNLKTLGADVTVCSVIGDDDSGKELLEMFQKIEVNTQNILIQQKRKTSKKTRLIAVGQQIVRYDKETKDAISQNSTEQLLELLSKTIQKYDAIILSDYAKGVLTPQLTQGIIALAKSVNVKVLVDPKGEDFSKYRGAYLLTPNKKEAMLATNIEIKDEQSLEKALLKLKIECELDVSLITLSEDGIATYTDKVQKFPTVAKEIFDITGAGDTVIASIAYALSLGKNIEETAKFANLSAGVVVGKVGSATVSLAEIEEYKATLHKSNSDAHIKNFKEISEIVQHHRMNGKRVIFTNGCFDILHIGHVKYLQIAKSFGDILIVGLNSDSSVSKLKGPTRPVNIAEDRAYLLAALEAVDFVVPFEEETPYNLIKMIKPDVLVKGGDYKGKKVVGSEFAKELQLVDFVDGKSTSKIIEKIEGNIC